MQLQGRLTSNAILRYTKTGKAVATLRVADNDVTDRGIKFYDVTLWDALAEQYGSLRQGLPVKVTMTAPPVLETYKKKDGTEGKAFKLTGQRVELLSFDELPVSQLVYQQAKVDDSVPSWGHEESALVESDIPY